MVFTHIKLSVTESLPRVYYLNRFIWPMDWGTIWKKLDFSLTLICFYEFMPSD